MIKLYDQKEVLEDYIASVKREWAEEKDRKIAGSAYDLGVSVNIIAQSLDRSVSTIEQWLGINA